MNIKCSKCGTLIEISPQITSSPKPRVACPRCRTRYRLKARAETRGAEASGGAPGPPATAGLKRTAPPAPPAPPAPGAPENRPTAPVLATPPVATAPARPVSAPPPSVFSPGDVLARRYRIVRFLAQGGMGEVYEAQDVELFEQVALKTISAGATDPGAIDRFKREISLARKVTHPNVCRIFDLGQHTATHGGVPMTFLTMELLRGETLARTLRKRKRLSTAIALPLARQIAAALDAAHGAQVVHRDLKSENIFLVRDDTASGGPGGATAGIRAVVTDFGIARGGQNDQFAARVTGTGIVGTPAYMAPEQVAGEPVTAAADIYAFGVVLYEMVTGHLPFESKNPLTMAAKRLQEPPQSPRRHVPELEPLWEEVILRCLERDPLWRFSSAGEVVASLAGAEHPPQATPHPTWGAPTHPTATPVRNDTHAPFGQTHGSAALKAEGHAPPTSPPSKLPTATPAGAPPSPTPPVAETPAPDGVASTATLTTGALYPPSTSQVALKKKSSALRPLLLTLGLVAAISAGLFIFNYFRTDGTKRVPRRSVAVVGFHNLSGQAEHDWLKTALTEMLGTELARGETLRTIPGDRIASAKKELAISNPIELSEDKLRQVYSLLGCDFVLSGTFVAAPQQLRIDVRLADAAVGTELASFAQQGDDTALFELVKSLGAEVRTRLGVDEESGGEDPLAGLPADRQAAKLYSEALDDLRRFDPLTARDALLEAARIEPQNPLIRSALSSAWQAMGHEERAAAEAAEAFELSSELPREDRLVIQGQLREIEGDWDGAAEVYRQLWEFFPDNLEYGLRLSAAQTAARRPAEAQVTVAELRALPPPTSEDVRIDLAEAGAAAVAADFELQLTAAERGARKADELGATLLAARARVAAAQALRFLGRSKESADVARTAHKAYTALDHPTGSALALIALASAQFDLAEFDEAVERSQEAIEIYRRIGDDGGLASALNNLGLALKKKGDLEPAQALYEEARSTYETNGNQLGLANVNANLAAVLILRDELARAKEMFSEARAVWEEAGETARGAIMLNNIAAVERLLGRLGKSREANEEALAIRRRIGQKAGEVFSLSNLGGTLVDLGELDEAEKLLLECRTLAEETGYRSALGHCLFELAELRFIEGRLEETRHLHEESLIIREELAEKQSIAESRSALARLKLAQGEPAAAELDARHAIDAFSKDGRRAEEGRATAFLALSLAEQSLMAEASRTLRDAQELAGESQQFAIRFRIRFASALLAAQKTRQKAKILRELEDDAEKAGFAPLLFEARLARLHLGGSGSANAAAELKDLHAAASSKGFSWVEKRAAEALGN